MTQIYFAQARRADDVLRLTLGAAQFISLCGPRATYLVKDLG